jgi:hypothetical protein
MDTNIVGPNMGKYFDIRLGDGRLEGKLENDLEGNYVQKVSFPREGKPVVEVSYRGNKFPSYVIPASFKKRWGISIEYGLADPLRDFGKLYDNRAQTIHVSAGRHLNNQPWALSLQSGSTRFKDKFGDLDNRVINLNLTGKYVFLYDNKWIQPYVDFGPGYYWQQRDHDQFGATVGAGIAIHLGSSISVEAASSWHYLC